jgi:hypothetical protein
VHRTVKPRFMAAAFALLVRIVGLAVSIILELFVSLTVLCLDLSVPLSPLDLERVDGQSASASGL